jgi:hypothetical protein
MMGCVTREHGVYAAWHQQRTATGGAQASTAAMMIPALQRNGTQPGKPYLAQALARRCTGDLLQVLQWSWHGLHLQLV